MFLITQRRSTRLGVVVATAALVLIGVLLGGPQVASANTLKTFASRGYYKWTVPSGVTSILIDAYGASGGNIAVNVHGEIQIVAYGGPGGEARGRFKVKPGQVLEIVVGGQGTNDGVGGFNGGGYARSTSQEYAAGGGGASDVRIGTTGNPCAAIKSCTFSDRIIVGGGGGGAAYQNAEGDGLPGGGLNGGSSSSQSAGGSQKERYSGDTCPSSYWLGCFGQGGGYDRSGSTQAEAGGGSGWYGGDASWFNDQNKGGSGGSGYVSPLATSLSFPGGTHTGDGLVVIKT